MSCGYSPVILSAEILFPPIVFTTTGLTIAAFVAGLPLMVKPVQTAFAEVPKRLHQVMDGQFDCANELSLLLALFAGLSFYVLRRYGAL